MEERMEINDRSYYPIHNSIDDDMTTDFIGVTRRKRDVPPADYTLKIDSFSFLSNILSTTDVEKYHSGIFEVGGYKWKLSLYPNGDLKRNGNGYISLYLILEDGDLLPTGLEIYVEFKLFLYNHIEDNYLIVQDGGETVCRFHKLKTEHGFSQFISIATFYNASNGYLLNDSCAFGAEVCVLKNKSKGEYLSKILNPNVSNSDFTWRLAYSKLDSKLNISKYFSVGGRSWSLIIYPKIGDTYLHLNLEMREMKSYSKILRWFYTSSLERNKVYAEFTLLIKDQIHNKHLERSFRKWFTPGVGCGFCAFKTLDDFNDPSKGYLVDDIFIAEVKFSLIYAPKTFI